MVQGSCLCGKVRYSCEIYSDKIFNCHCQFCRKAHGADYATLAIADGRTLVVDDAKGLLRAHKNGLGGFRAFCGECGSRLMNYGPDKAAYLSVTLSTIDTPNGLKPVAHVNVESKAGWCAPSTDLPSFPGFPPNARE